MLKIQFLKFSLVIGCILFIKPARVTNQVRELNWEHACALVHDCAHLIERPTNMCPYFLGLEVYTPQRQIPHSRFYIPLKNLLDSCFPINFMISVLLHSEMN